MFSPSILGFLKLARPGVKKKRLVYDENFNFKKSHSFHVVYSFKVILYLQDNVSWQEILASAINFEIFYSEDPLVEINLCNRRRRIKTY